MDITLCEDYFKLRTDGNKSQRGGSGIIDTNSREGIQGDLSKEPEPGTLLEIMEDDHRSSGGSVASGS